MPKGKRLKIHGTPGNDMACYMDGGEIEVFGNAQDQIGNTMNDGRIVVHGRCGDAAGYGMRGGTILVRDDCGWRVGIHMKEYEAHRPAIVIGGDAGSFLGEYMAGGVIVLLGKPGAYLATGMHGGVIYTKGRSKARPSWRALSTSRQTSATASFSGVSFPSTTGVRGGVGRTRGRDRPRLLPPAPRVVAPLREHVRQLSMPGTAWARARMRGGEGHSAPGPREPGPRRAHPAACVPVRSGNLRCEARAAAPARALFGCAGKPAS